MYIWSNLLNKGVDKPELYCIDNLLLYTYSTGLQAAIIVVLAFNFVDIPALLLLIVCYSNASKIDYYDC